MWYIYIVKCNDSSYYTGITTDVPRRIYEHNHGVKAAKYTKWRRPVELVYMEKSEGRSQASKREYEIKQMTQQQKKALIDIYQSKN